MHCSLPGFPVHHQIPELAQTHVHQASDAIQPSHPLLSPSPPAFNLSQHQGLFQLSNRAGCNGPRGSVAVRSFPTPEVRGCGREELPHPGAQGPCPRGATPPPRSGCCAGAGGRGATPRSRSGGAAVRRHPSSKVRETQVRR